MKKTNFTKIMTLCLMVFGMLSTLNVQAQCPVGETEVTVDYTVGGFNGENSWVLWDATAGAQVSCGGQGPAGGATVACATDGNDLELHTFETFGDGWCAPAAINVSSSEDGSVNGCNAQSIEFFDGVPAVSGNGSYNCVGTPNGFIAASFQVACILCEINAPADLTVSSDPGVCGASVTLGLATLSADCDPTDVIINDFNGGGADASDDYPVGSTTVTYSTAGGTVLATTVVTVLDTEAPELGCPATTSVGLDGGECNSAYFFDVTATDNCPQDAFTAVGPYCDPCVAPTGGSALACTAGPNQIIQIIDAPAGGTEVTEVCFNQESFGSAPTITVNVYAYDGVNVPYDGGGFTPVATATLALSGADDGSCICVPFDAGQVVPAGVTQLAIEIVAPFGRAVQTPATCDGATSAGDLSYIVAPACGLTTPGLFNGIGFNLDASYSISLLPPALEAIPSPTAPDGFNAYESGDLLPIGTHCFQYEATDGAGNLSTCDWCVTVVEFPGPYANLSCNANINVSVDENCEAIITPDMVLEGSAHQCYENYNVTVSGITPASAVVGNGTNNVIIKASQVDGWEGGMFGPFEVSVSDPNDANNSCWNGGWMLEDKLAPTIDCDTITISCLTDIAPGGATSSGTASASNAEGVSWADGDTGVVGEFDVEVSGIPAGATTDKVTVDINLDHSWMGDVTIDLISPSGQSVTLIDGNCGINDNVNATFDSDASNGISCAAGATGGPHETCPGDWATFATINNTVQPVGDLSTLAGQAANGTWSVIVTDGVGGDGGCLDASNFSIDVAWTLQGTGAPTVAENCGQYELTHDDNVTNFDCTTGAPFVQVIERTWTIVDEKGNSASCVQVINVTPSTLADLTLPRNYDNLDLPALDCSNANTDPSNTGNPEGSCSNISATYEDLVFDEICEGSYKILRQWTILDWCTGDIAEHNQTIKVLDTTAPTFGAIADLNESTTTNSCLANVVLPAPSLSDDCSSETSYTASASAGDLLPANGGYVLYGLPIGTHTVTYEATDDCGNTSTISFDINVTDDIVPVAICETFHVVNLTTNEPTLVYATTFDDGSYDNCELESMEVRRMGNANNVCIDFDWTTDGPGIDEIPNGSSDLRRDKGVTFWYPAVPFACCDVGEEHMVEFRVTDVNGNSNTCMVSIEVDDKLDPVITGPANATYECSEYINESSDIAIDGLNQDEIGARAYYVELNGPGSADNDTTFVGWYANAFDNCEATVFIRDAGAINECGITTPFINRFYTAIDGGGRTDVAVQRLTVVNSYPYFITDTSPFSPQNRDGVRWPTDRTLSTCDALTDPSATGEPLIQDDLTIFNITVDGVFYSEYPMESTCSQIAVTYTDLDLPVVDGACKKILRTWTVIDWCQYDNNGATPEGIWTYEQIIKIENSNAPEFDSCESPATFAINSSTNGNCLATVTLTANATDDCTSPGDINYTYWIDAFNDGTDDIGGNTSSFFSTQIPAGTHSIKWTAEDGCGNITVCEYLFTAADLDGPTVYALNGIAVDLGQADQADVWASDLDNGSYDNCSDICDMRIGVPSQGPGQTAPPTADNYVFDCDDLAQYGSNIPVDLWVKDCANNWSYASTYVLLEDNSLVCDNNTAEAAIIGTISTEMTESVESVEVAISGNAPGIPASAYTNNAGAYGTPGLPVGYNYEVTPSLNLEPLNGVSTYDLVLISKHILGITALDSPYKQIAADVNNSGSITTFDMVELRKLILFIDTEFQNNTSWRFVEADYVFDNANNPFATVFPELTAINNLTATEIADYVGVKVGDVNGSAIPNSLVGGEDRTTVADLVFNIDNQKMVAGEEYTVDFKANDFNNIMGYQFTMSFDTDAVEFVNMTAGNLTQLSEGNFGLNKVNEGVITTSWNNTNATALNNDEVVFSVTFKAKSAAQVSDVITVNSRYTAAEAYNAELELMGVAVEYNTENGAVTAGFDLYQNTPNPFKAETVIGFNLPVAGNASLKVYDVAGRVLKLVEGDFAKGYNEVTLNRSELSATGVMYYTLETATDSATKKMIIVE